MDFQTLELEEHERSPTAIGNLPERSDSDHTDSTLDASLIADALSQLNHEHLTVIVRAYYRGESVAELAGALDLPPGTVKSRLHYGVRTLQIVLQENAGSGR